MNGKKHSLHPFRGKQEEFSSQLLMMTDKRIVNDWKDEDEVKVISQVNDFEIKMTNKVCLDWLKERSYQQEMSNASMVLMEEAECEVIKGGERYMTNEITKDGDVTKIGKGEKSQEIHARNSWMTDIFMLMYFLFAYVTRNLIYLYEDKGEPVEKLFAGQRKK